MGHNNLYNCKLYFNLVFKQQIKVFYLNICSKRHFFGCSLVFQSTEISLKSRSKENHWRSRCDQLSEVIQSKWKCWKPNYSIEEMIAWTSSFPWKCEPSCSPPQGTGQSQIYEMAQALGLQYPVAKALVGLQRRECIAACSCECNPFCTECFKNTTLKTQCLANKKY